MEFNSIHEATQFLYQNALEKKQIEDILYKIWEKAYYNGYEDAESYFETV